MKVKVLIFIALAIFIVGVTCQTTKPKKGTTAKFTTKAKGAAITPKKSAGKTTAKKGKAGEVTTTGPRLKAGSASSPPVFTAPPIPPVYTCDNITGIATFKFADFATGRWFLHREMCAFPFNPWFGICGVGNFTLDAAKTSSSVVVSTFFEGVFTNSAASTLTPVAGTSGIMNWAISTVGTRNDTMPSKSTLKMVVIDTDYLNWAGIYVCGNLCVQVPSNKPANAATACSPGSVTGFMILLRSRTLAKDQEETYIKSATDALNVKWPYMLFMPDEQNPMVCKN